MTEGVGKLLWDVVRDVVIAVGVFVPLIDFVYHLLQTHAGGVNVLHLPASDLLILLTLTLAPLALLRWVYAPDCRVPK